MAFSCRCTGVELRGCYVATTVSLVDRIGIGAKFLEPIWRHGQLTHLVEQYCSVAVQIRFAGQRIEIIKRLYSFPLAPLVPNHTPTLNRQQRQPPAPDASSPEILP